MRKFYIMGQESGGRLGLELENKTAIIQPGSRILAPPSGQRGFPKFSETPRFVFDKKKGHLPRDFEVFSVYRLVSDRMKRLMESIDSEAVVFEKCDARLLDGKSGGEYWLCDLVRVIDAVDEAASDVKLTAFSDGSKTHNLMAGANLTLREADIGVAHIFRMATYDVAWVCDDIFKAAYDASELKGVNFRDVTKIGQH